MASTEDVKPLDRFEWERIIRRLEIPSSVKFLALMLATYSDPDGSRVRPGVERLALVMGVTDRTVKRSLSSLRDYGLLEKVRHGNRHAGLSDEYRLTVPVNLLELPMLDPEESRRQV